MKKRRQRIIMDLLGILLLGMFLSCALWISQENRIQEADKKQENEKQPDAETSMRLSVQQTLDMENVKKAEELSCSSVAYLTVFGEKEKWNGSAVIWEQTEEEIILATSAHLLEKAQDTLLVSLEAEEEGQKADAGLTHIVGRSLGYSADTDVGFVACAKTDLAEELLTKLTYVRLHQRTYDTVSAKDICFAAGYSAKQAKPTVRQLIFSQKDYTEEEIGTGLFLLDGACEPGMSGSGLFDGYGHLIGLIVATDTKQTLALPMATVNAAWKELTGNQRNTQDYSE